MNNNTTINPTKDKTYNNWRIDLNNASQYISQITASLNIEHEMVSIEKTPDNGVLAWFDKFAGIDWIGKTPDNNLYGVAVRVQWTNNPFNSFTIRSDRHTGTKTEYQKRIEAIQHGYFYPAYTIQAYVDKTTDILLSAAIAKTKDLYEYVDKFSYEIANNKSDNNFKIVWWSKFQSRYQTIKIYEKP